MFCRQNTEQKIIAFLDNLEALPTTAACDNEMYLKW